MTVDTLRFVEVASRSPPPRELEPPSSNLLGELSAHAPIFASFDAVISVAIGRIVPHLNPVSRVFQWLIPPSHTFCSFAVLLALVEHIETGSKEPDEPLSGFESAKRRYIPTKSSKEKVWCDMHHREKTVRRGGELNELFARLCLTSGPAMWRLASLRTDNCRAVSIRQDSCDIRFAFPNRATKIYIQKTEPGNSERRWLVRIVGRRCDSCSGECRRRRGSGRAFGEVLQ